MNHLHSFTQKELEEGFYLLIKEGILKPIMKFRDEWIYGITDGSLNDLLLTYFHIFNKLQDIINLRWTYIGRPTTEELKWFEVFYGKEKTDNIRLRAYRRRHSSNKKKRKSFAIKARGEIKKVRKYINEVMTEIEVDYADTIKKYNFP